MKYKLLTLALLPILALILTACTPQEVLGKLPLIGTILFPAPKSDVDLTKQVSLNVWGLWENPEAMKAMVSKYNETYPNIKITYDDRSVLNMNDYKQTVFTRIGESQTADVMRVHQSWTPKLKDNLAPIPESLMSLETLNSEYYPMVSKYQVSDGRIYGLPTYYDGLVLVYNKNHFKEIGQSEAPTSWEQFRRLSQELTVRGENESIVRAGAAMGTSNNNEMYADIMSMLFKQAGLNIPEDLDSSAASDTLVFYTNFVTKDKVWSTEFPEATTAFVQGKVSMIFVPSWKLLDVLKSVNELSFEIGVSSVPQIRTDNPVTWGSYWVYVVPKASPNADVAWHFINFLSSQDQQLMMFNESAKYRQYGTPYSLVSMSGQLDNSPYLKAVLEYAKYAEGGETSGRSGNDKQVIPIRDAINDVLGGTPSQTVVSKLKESLKTAL